jgi:hypothetical protein
MNLLRPLVRPCLPFHHDAHAAASVCAGATTYRAVNQSGVKAGQCAQRLTAELELTLR